MTDFEIVKNYLETKYPNYPYSMREGNKCVWVSLGRMELYFIIRDQKIVDIQVD